MALMSKGVYAPAHDSDDEIEDIPDGTEATIPLSHPMTTLLNRKGPFSSPPPYVTQPTQVVPTPSHRKSSPASVVQVQASSPLPQASSPHAPNPIRPPPGTYLRPIPKAIVPTSASGPSYDDPPVEISSSEDELSFSRANIKPSTFASGGRSQVDLVEETPKKSMIDFSQFKYDPLQRPQKRPMDDTASAYASSSRKRHQATPRQTGPSRAMPVAEDISLEDIVDFEVRQKVMRLSKVYPEKSLAFLRDALAAKHGNVNDTLDYVAQLEDDVIAISDDDPMSAKKAPVFVSPAKPKPVTKREVNSSRSIMQKWSSTQSAPQTAKVPDVATKPHVPEPFTPPKPRRRLVQGRKQQPAEPVEPSPQPNLAIRKKAITIDSDASDSAVSSDDDQEDDDVALSGFDDRVLKFFNTCSPQDLADASSQPAEVAEFIISKRPFKTLDQVRRVDKDTPAATGKGKRKTNRKTLGEKVVDICEEILTGYEAVDELVSRCEALGKPIATEMKKWGINTSGASPDGELSATSFSVKTDSGIGTPSSLAATTDDEADVSANSRSKQKLLEKPKVMSETLQLKDYQIVGLNWLHLLWSKNLSCILADDMGLGKTCQVITFLSHLFEIGVKGPHLVVVPGSTLENWLREFKTFSDKLVVEPYYGSQAERSEQRDIMEDRRDEIYVVVTTYDTAYKDADNKFLRKILRPSVCVYDEGHMLRNSTSQRYKQLMRIPADFRLLLTGTPLQNNLQELASLLAFIMPQLFAEKQEELSYIFKHKAKTTDADHAALLSAQRIARARSMMTPFILRRKKQQVLKHLPAKTCRVEYCELNSAQQEIYNEQIARQRQVLEDRAAGRENKDHANIIMKLRQAAIHPLLFRQIYTDATIRKMSRAIVKENSLPGRDPDAVYEDMEWYNDFNLHKLCLQYPTTLSKFALKNEEWMESGKVQKLCELLLKFKENGDRALIFSQFTTVMDILEVVLETLDMAFFRLDGSTPISRRQDMFDEFYSDESIPVFMLSTKSGGAGINLACANKVIIFDSSFNPQDDIQAENRAHRVGQTREVEVIRLVTKGTIEEQIHALGQSKLALDERVAGEATKKDEERVEKEAMDIVEQMMLEKMKEEDKKKKNPPAGKKGGGGGNSSKDLKTEYMNGLKEAGLTLAA